MSENLIGYSCCFLAGVASTVATYLMRVSNLNEVGGSFLSLQRSVYLVVAIGIYGIGFAFYSLALRKLPMTIAYPMMTAMTILMVSLVGIFVLQESIGVIKMIGIVALTIGALLVTV